MNNPPAGWVRSFSLFGVTVEWMSDTFTSLGGHYAFTASDARRRQALFYTADEQSFTEYLFYLNVISYPDLGSANIIDLWYGANNRNGPYQYLAEADPSNPSRATNSNGDEINPTPFIPAEVFDIYLDSRNRIAHMELSERLNKLASDKGTAGKQGVGLALAALVLLDKDNNVQFDGDDLPATLARILGAGDVAIPSGKTIGTDLANYAGTHSYQPVGPDLNLDPAAGSTVDDPKFLAAVMGNVIGEDITKEGAYLAGVIGALSIMGARATKYQIAALMGIVMDGVTDADGAVVALIDGSDPSSVTRARAAFAVAMNNNNAGSGVDYGLDLLDVVSTRLAGAFSGTAKPFAIAKATVRSPKEVCILESVDVPVDGTTGLNFAGKGSLCTDYTHGEAYINTGTKAAPVWKKLTHA